MNSTPIFGTDGIRGKAGISPLDQDTLNHLGVCLAEILREDMNAFSPQAQDGESIIVLGGDTRESTPDLAAWMYSGLNTGSCTVHYVGLASTPEIAFLTRALGARLGIVISASHNHWQDNGIKFFSPEGWKISADMETRIDQALHTRLQQDAPLPPAALPIQKDNKTYQHDLIERFSARLDLGGMRIAIDCANGACAYSAPTILQALGAEVIANHIHPNGRNINDHCGALHPEQLRKSLLAQQADIGLSLDGDGDRVMFMDETGEVRDGDFALAILAGHYQRQGALPSQTVVGTVMSNLGLEKTLHAQDLKLIRTPVGDKYIAEEMRTHQYNLGGEQSGHLLIRTETTTGDGLLSALVLLEALAQGPNTRLSEASAVMQKCPQILLNIRVREKKSFDAIPGLSDTVTRIEKQIHQRGRLLLRYSGTENLARVMLEGDNQREIEDCARQLEKVIAQEIGV